MFIENGIMVHFYAIQLRSFRNTLGSMKCNKYHQLNRQLPENALHIPASFDINYLGSTQSFGSNKGLVKFKCLNLAIPTHRSFTMTAPIYKKKHLRSPPQNTNSLTRLTSMQNPGETVLDGENEDSDFDNLSELVDIQLHSSMLQSYHLEALDTQQVLVVQPNYLNSSNPQHVDKRKELMLSESVGLVQTLGWTVVDAVTMDTDCNDKKTFYSEHQLSLLRDHISRLESPAEKKEHLKSNTQDDLDETKVPKYISAVFVSTFRLYGSQRITMEEILQKPVLDRYNVVLQIFKRHAKSKEAILQSELAEIPYLRSRLLSDYDIELVSKHDPRLRKGEKWFSARRMALAKREKKLRNEIEKIYVHRATMRKNRTKLQIPSVAIVGYTNAGKTSLIKALTGRHNLSPRNQLFATLDVTVHACRLPSTLDALLVDTVGFISDIPTDLIASFNATLEDAALADVLVHVRDVANPDNVSQNEEVRRTLRQLDLPDRLIPHDGDISYSGSSEVGADVITVGNKIDLLEPNCWSKIKDDGMIPVSCAKGYGLDFLLHRIEGAIMKSTGRKKVIFRVPVASGTEEYAWLQKNTHICEATVDPENENYWLVQSIVRNFDVERFEKQFVGKRGAGKIDKGK